MESAITLIAEGKSYYRGHDAVDLSENRSLEQVAEIIWTGNMPEGERRRLPELFRMPSVGRMTVTVPPRSGHEETQERAWTYAFGIALQRAVAQDPAAYDLRTAAVVRTGTRIL